MYVMFLLRPFTVHNVFPCFYGPNKVIIITRFLLDKIYEVVNLPAVVTKIICLGD